MKLFDTLLKKKMQKTLKEMGVNENDLDLNSLGMSSENLMALGQKLQSMIASDPVLKNIDLRNVASLMQHKDALRRLFEEHKEELQGLMKKQE